MMKKQFVIGSIILCAMISALLTLFARHKPTSPGDWASWVQAFGSILALATAIAVPYIQRYNDALAANRVLKAKAEVVADGVLNANVRILGLLDSAVGAYATEIGRVFENKLAGRMADALGGASFPEEASLLHMAEIWPTEVRQLATAYGLAKTAILGVQGIAKMADYQNDEIGETFDHLVLMMRTARKGMVDAHNLLRPEHPIVVPAP